MPQKPIPAPEDGQTVRLLPDIPESRKPDYRRARRAKELGVLVDQVPDRRGRHGNHARGPENGRWNEGRMLSSHGYVLVRVGSGHPMAFGNGYAYEHDLVMVAYLGRRLAPDEVVHHTGDKTDNRIEKLELKTGSQHMAEHIAERERDAKGRLLPIRDSQASGPAQ